VGTIGGESRVYLGAKASRAVSKTLSLTFTGDRGFESISLQHPRVVVTTTPKPIRIIRELIADPTTVITRGSTYDNRANLAPAFLEQIIRKYEGTRLGASITPGQLLRC
jgi:phage terminase large subunit-like protein